MHWGDFVFDFIHIKQWVILVSVKFDTSSYFFHESIGFSVLFKAKLCCRF